VLESLATGLRLPFQSKPATFRLSRPSEEIYRYRLDGPNYSLNELKATQDWPVYAARFKQVSGIVDVAGFGGSTSGVHRGSRFPASSCKFAVTLPQVVAAVSASNANAGGNYLTMGSQSVNVRGVGLLQSIQDMQSS